jgi:H+/Na+-translocating ferredoxin:NAD+ oxidoreductase subunit B
MFEAIATMFFMGVGLGTLLGVAARRFQVESNPIIDELEEMMPGTNCGQCGFPGCRPAIEAVVEGNAPVTLCPPGGAQLAVELAERLRIEADLSEVSAQNPLVAFIFEDQCVGCTKCFKRCPTDAIVGASRQIHTVINDACIGCKACLDACPTEAIIVRALPVNLQTWYWPKPGEESLVPSRQEAMVQ